ncbi:unnamed protein product, partial [Urochloa humidicola]
MHLTNGKIVSAVRQILSTASSIQAAYRVGPTFLSFLHHKFLILPSYLCIHHTVIFLPALASTRSRRQPDGEQQGRSWRRSASGRPEQCNPGAPRGLGGAAPGGLPARTCLRRAMSGGRSLQRRPVGRSRGQEGRAPGGLPAGASWPSSPASLVPDRDALCESQCPEGRLQSSRARSGQEALATVDLVKQLTWSTTDHEKKAETFLALLLRKD